MCPRAQPDYQMGPEEAALPALLPAGLVTVPTADPPHRLLRGRNLLPAPTEAQPPCVRAEDTPRGTLSTWSHAC